MAKKKTLKKQKSFSAWRPPLFVAFFAVTGTVFIWNTLASPNKTTLASGPLTLASEEVRNSPNPSAPNWCLNEDDHHIRRWNGSLNGTFTATERLCDYNIDKVGGIAWSAGGIGIQAELLAIGTVNNLSITSPTGDVHQAVLVGSTTSGSGKNAKTINHYRVCYVPPFALASDTGGQSLPGGTWTITLSGNLATVLYKGDFSVTAAMANVRFQQSRCPVSQQNLL